MAATIARAIGHDTTGRTKEATRLGSRSTEAEAATWRTFARVEVQADGSGLFTITRDGVAIHAYRWGPE